MSSFRIYVLLAVVIAAVARGAHHAGSTMSCPMPMGSKRLYGNSTVACAAARACGTTYCTCVGGTVTGALTCTKPSTLPNCTKASWCARDVIKCLNAAADPTNNCPGLKDLHMSLLAFETASAPWNASNVYHACRYRTCRLVNETAGNNCTLDFHMLCPPPMKMTTAAPTTAAPTTASPSSATPVPPTPRQTGGAAMTSLFAAAVVALLSVVLF